MRLHPTVKQTTVFPPLLCQNPLYPFLDFSRIIRLFLQQSDDILPAKRKMHVISVQFLRRIHPATCQNRSKKSSPLHFLLISFGGLTIFPSLIFRSNSGHFHNTNSKLTYAAVAARQHLFLLTKKFRYDILMTDKDL